MAQDASHQFREDLRKDPKDLAHEADFARAELEHTFEALERRLSPGEIMDQMLDLVRRNGGEFGTNLMTQVRNNPMPTLLAGAGLTWLMTSSAHPPEREAGGTGRLADHASAAASATRGAGRQARDAMHGAAEAARSAAGAAQSTAHSASAAAHGAADTVRSAGSGLARASRTGAENMRETYLYMSREQPLVLGALAVAAGAAIGALLPPTQAEEELMGDASEDVKDRLMAEGERRAGDVQAAAADMAEAAERHIERGSSERGGPATAAHESSASAEGSSSAESAEHEPEPGRRDPLRPDTQA